MANNLDNALDVMTTLVQPEWRKTCVMPMLVDNQYDPEISPAHKGQEITLFDVEEMTAQPVVPGWYPNNVQDVKVKGRSLVLEYYEEVPFVLTGQDWSSINQGVLPRSYKRAVEGLAERIDQSIYKAAAKWAYNTVGTAGTTPFASDIDILSEAATRLTTGKAPKADRCLAIDEYAMQNARKLTQFREADKAGTQETLRTGIIGEAYGFMFAESNNIPTHTTTASGTYVIDASGSIGNTTITVDNGSDALPAALIVGDVLSIAGSDQQYVVTSYTAGATEAVVGIFPALDQAIAVNDVVTVKASHKLNLAFHKESIAFASRPNVDRPMTPSVVYELIPDPLTGVVLDLRIQDHHRQVGWSIGCLWGVTVPPLKEGGIVRVLG